jgi:predicted anti-sigma-YlaC factor YlaD
MRLQSERVRPVRVMAWPALRARIGRVGVARGGQGRSDVSCADVALALPEILDGGPAADEAVVEHVGECLSCQAELAKYRKLLRLLNQLSVSEIEPPPGLVADVLGALGRSARRRMIRSLLTGRRLAYTGAVLVPTVAVVVLTLAHRGRLRRVGSVVLS